MASYIRILFDQLNVYFAHLKFNLFPEFPDVVGCVDGTHIPIVKPPVDTHEYINRKGYASINVQVKFEL